MTPHRLRRRRALAHQCPACRRPWALRADVDAAGPVIACVHCGLVRWRPATALEGGGVGVPAQARRG
ncbi:hypothetical protein [Quadrisphaera sp. DSM 44207]|uniref:hypothetical protein n=1 Tax=Quadrisphaera sp. DSM 44207 TaxID=1881057 RepID=UPI00087F294D|nr:hypothetical protein [Quadrisphaera sp. DSM 44207]SDQ08111.1 hypothetical protein SAMN05428996_0416 [Quadrisphaera sp. DSM 44207]